MEILPIYKPSPTMALERKLHPEEANNTQKTEKRNNVRPINQNWGNTPPQQMMIINRPYSLITLNINILNSIERQSNRMD